MFYVCVLQDCQNRTAALMFALENLIRQPGLTQLHGHICAGDSRCHGSQQACPGLGGKMCKVQTPHWSHGIKGMVMLF